MSTPEAPKTLSAAVRMVIEDGQREDYGDV